MEILACFEVPVDDVQPVQVPNPLQQVPEEKGDLLVLEWQAKALPLLDEGFESAALDVLHPDDQALVGLEEGVELDDVLVVDRGQDLCLLGEEALLGVINRLLFDHLHGDGPTLTAKLLPSFGSKHS